MPTCIVATVVVFSLCAPLKAKETFVVIMEAYTSELFLVLLTSYSNQYVDSSRKKQEDRRGAYSIVTNNEFRQNGRRRRRGQWEIYTGLCCLGVVWVDVQNGR